MNLRHLLSRVTVRNVSRFNARRWNYREICTAPCVSPLFHLTSTKKSENCQPRMGDLIMGKLFHSGVGAMRGMLNEVYGDASKNDIDAMLQLIVGKVVMEIDEGCLSEDIESASALASEDFNEDLWRTVWEVSHIVLEDMKKARKMEKMKAVLQSEQVKELTRLAGEKGIHGDLLIQLRFKWAREKIKYIELFDDACLPERSRKIKYNISGLDLSKPKWAEVAIQIHEAGGGIWQQEPKCKIVTENILSLKVDDDPAPLLVEWIELLQPSRVDWVALVDRLKEKNVQVYFKVAEHLLDEESFQADIGDFSQLVDAHAKHNQFTDAERIIKKMNEKGILPDILTKTSMVHMYSKAGKLDLAKEAFESLETQGFQPDLKAYNSMIMAYISAGEHKKADFLLERVRVKE